MLAGGRGLGRLPCQYTPDGAHLREAETVTVLQWESGEKDLYVHGQGNRPAKSVQASFTVRPAQGRVQPIAASTTSDRTPLSGHHALGSLQQLAEVQPL